MSQWLLASGNAGKKREFSRLLAPFSIHLRAVDTQSVIEDGRSFVENALLKARAAANAGAGPVLADDSGLLLSGLDGRPGLYSARYAGVGATDDANNQRLVAELAECGTGSRQACYHAALVLLRDAADPCPLVAQARWWGEIRNHPSGGGGFGYDPHFYLPVQRCTAAELSPADKDRLGHRGRALRRLVKMLQNSRGMAAEQPFPPL